MSGDLRPLQKMFLQAGAIKKAWRQYLAGEFGEAVAKQSQSLFGDVLQDLVSEMADNAIKEMAAQFIQCTDITDRERAQLAAIIEY